jgi:hypothetical protein
MLQSVEHVCGGIIVVHVLLDAAWSSERNVLGCLSEEVLLVC